MEVTVYLDDVERSLPVGPMRIAELRSGLGIPSDLWLAVQDAGFDRFVVDHEEIVVRAALRLMTCAPLTYRPHPKHKREPARGRKGSLCPSGVGGHELLAVSYRVEDKPRRCWATRDGLAYCAMNDNAGGWHGYPVPMTAVPASIWRNWLASGKISTSDLKAATIPKR